MSTFQPPIHLDPSQDPGQQTAFINQNFQSLAAALETNSFRIVGSGLAVIPTFNFSTGANQYAFLGSSTQIAHNLGFIPAFLAYAGGSGVSIGSTPQIGFSVGTSGFTQSFTQITSDKNNIYFFNDAYGFNQTTPFAVPATTIQYYLLQQTAS